MGSRNTYALALAGLMTMSFGAHAADLGPVMAPAPAPMPMIEAPAPMAEDYGGWYLRGDLGIGATNAKGFSIVETKVGGLGTSTFFPGANEVSGGFFAGLGIGYQVNSWFRTDLTIEYRGGMVFTGTDQYTNPSMSGCTTLTGNCVNTYRSSLSSVIAMLNGYVDLGSWYGFTPYVGAGLGMAYNRFGMSNDTCLTGGSGGAGACSGVINPGFKTNLAWALMVGTSYDLSARAKIDIGYRYLNYGSFQSGEGLSSSGQVSNLAVRTKTLDSHDFRIGFRYLFGGPTTTLASAPMMESMPAPMPAPMPVPLVTK